MTAGSAGCDVLVLGGGLHGCSTALHLALMGARVLVLEKDRVGRHASGVNAGGVRRLARDLREVALSVESLKMWHAIGELVDDDCGFVAHGQLQVAETEEELAEQRRRVAALDAIGFHHEVLVDRDELRRIVPAVADHCVGGLWAAEDGAAMPYHTTLAFRRKGERLGVTFEEGAAVVSLSRVGRGWHVATADGRRFEAPVVVNCCGAWSGRICALVDEHAPVEPIAPMLMITAALPPFLAPVVSAAGRVLSFKQMSNGTVMIGGGLTGRALPDRNRAELDFAKLGTNARTVRDLFPIMRHAGIVRAWAGIEGRMPDDIPVIGASALHEGLFHGFGFSAHGFQLGPFGGRVLALLAAGRGSPIDLADFRIDRFTREAGIGHGA